RTTLMSLSQDDLIRLAKLSLLNFSEAELNALQPRLNQLTNVIAELASIDTLGAQPLIHPFDGTAPLRTDAVTEPDYRDQVLPLSANTADSHYVVPQVIEE